MEDRAEKCRHVSVPHFRDLGTETLIKPHTFIEYIAFASSWVKLLIIFILFSLSEITNYFFIRSFIFIEFVNNRDIIVRLGLILSLIYFGINITKYILLAALVFRTNSKFH